MRIDKYLWSIRLFKTRSLATFSCNEEKVKLNEGFTKASKEIHAGDVIALKAPPVWRTFEILATPNFDAVDNLSDLIRMESVSKAQNMGNKGLDYGRSYSNSGLKAFAKSFEDLNSDIFFC